jgi:tetraacyldisaccharide 4'-kinase
MFAVAGIARPGRFFDALASAGWKVVGTMAFRDHYRFKDADVSRMVAAAASSRASIVVTTEKDAVRLEGRTFAEVPVAAVPLTLSIEPAAAFSDWIRDRLRATRQARQLHPQAESGIKKPAEQRPPAASAPHESP